MNLFLPLDPRPVHFVGIAGAGMSALAMVALSRGVSVTGSDRVPDGAPDLAGLGAQVAQGADPAAVARARAVVVSAAVPADHPDLVRARELGVPVVSRKRALAELVAGSTTIAIAGTHGKTTTTVMATQALCGAGFNPTGLAGGRVAAWGGNARIGDPAMFVVEADEYDRAFLELAPTVAVVGNVEPDHLECYGGESAALEEAFATFAARAETVIAGPGEACDRVAEEIRARSRTLRRLWRFGPGAGEVEVRDIRLERGSSRAEVRMPGGGDVALVLAVPGEHNLLNAAAALAVVHAVGGDVTAARDALREFKGVGRRFEVVGEASGVTVVDDYAHHPTEIRATLAAARQAYPSRRLIAVFQPHLYSRTAVHGPAMGQALAAADLALVTEVYAAREAPLPGVGGHLVVDAARQAGARARFAPDQDSLLRTAGDLLEPGDVVLTLGAGDITELGPRLLAHRRAR
jgi:UDP-N-acetylmuramate--alanine ligase